MGEHYFSADPTTHARSRRVEFAVRGQNFTLEAASGVFSANRLDTGTGVLLRKADLPGPEVTGNLLDLGCGYGPITCVLATFAPNATVYAVDVNARARELTARNARELSVKVSDPDGIPDNMKFRQIWSNPPIRIGKPELHELLLRWLPKLDDGGVAWLVVSKNLGGDSLQEWIVDQGFPTERHGSGAGYRVLKVVRPIAS